MNTENSAFSSIRSIPAKTILIRSKDPRWFGGDFTMNLYRGCVHSCIYCDSRSLCYRIDNFDEVCYKADCLSLLEKELAHKSKKGVIVTGAMSDPYNPFEKRLELTRNSLNIIDKYQFGIAIATKSDLLVRDRDILEHIRSHSPVLCKITITALDNTLARKLEPGAPSSTRRFVYPSFGVTMREGQREYFLHGLNQSFPDKNLKNQYISAYGAQYYCGSPKSKELWIAFQEACSATWPFVRNVGYYFTVPQRFGYQPIMFSLVTAYYTLFLFRISAI